MSQDTIGAEVVDRLRDSKKRGDDEMSQSGFTAGAEWAKSSAEAAELKRLERFHERIRRETKFDSDWWLTDDGESAYSRAELLAFEILGSNDGDCDRHEAASFWEQAIGPDNGNLHEGAYLWGFAKGALDVWSKVEAQL